MGAAFGVHCRDGATPELPAGGAAPAATRVGPVPLEMSYRDAIDISTDAFRLEFDEIFAALDSINATIREMSTEQVDGEDTIVRDHRAGLVRIAKERRALLEARLAEMRDTQQSVWARLNARRRDTSNRIVERIFGGGADAPPARSE